MAGVSGRLNTLGPCQLTGGFPVSRPALLTVRLAENSHSPPLGASGWPPTPCNASHGQGSHWLSLSEKEGSNPKLNSQEKLFPHLRGCGGPLGRGV